jgi:hypothetical protein
LTRKTADKTSDETGLLLLLLLRLLGNWLLTARLGRCRLLVSAENAA